MLSSEINKPSSGFFAVLLPEQNRARFPRVRQWLIVAAMCALNALAMSPMFWRLDPGGRNGPSQEEWLSIVAMMAALPILAVLQPWIGVIKLLRIARLSQILILLPSLAIMGVLSAILAARDGTMQPLAAGVVATLCSLISGLQQYRLWRWQAEPANPGG